LLGSGGQQVRMRVQDLREELPWKIEAAAAPEGSREGRVDHSTLSCSESDEFMVPKGAH
jgi:hypothetical protein